MTFMRISRTVALLLLIVAACSDGKPAATRTSSPSPTSSSCVGKAVPITFPRCPHPVNEISGPKDLTAQGDSVSLTLVAGDAIFDPTYIKVTSGAKVTLRFQGGPIRHDFNIDSLGVHHEVAIDTTTQLSFTLPTTGPVLFYCAPHLPNGMQGAFYFY
jgi:plastocyanin